MSKLPKYCSRCGRKLMIDYEYFEVFDERTGKDISYWEVIFICSREFTILLKWESNKTQ